MNSILQMFRKPLLFRFLFLFMPFAASLPAQIPLYSLQTKNLRLVYYDPNHTFLIPHIARCFENSMKFHKALFDYVPSEKTTILLQDWNDYGTAGTNVIPWNYLNVGIEPYDYVYETSPTNERFNWVMNHELVHILATDKAAGSDRFFRSLFLGKVLPVAENPLSMVYSFLTTPRWYSPRWYQEGLATFMETWMSGGIGRAQNGYDEMVFRAMVRDSCRFYGIVGLESEGTTVDFQVGVISYLYGTRFVSYLVHEYGPEKLLLWYNRVPGSRRSFAPRFKQVYGSCIGDAWSQWIGWENAWQRANLDRIREKPVTEHQDICPQPLGSVSRAFYDPARHALYAGLNYPGRMCQIASIDIRTGAIRKIRSMHTPALYVVTSLAFDPESGTLFYTTHNSTLWRGLCSVDVTTGRSRILIKNARIGDLAFNRADRSVWGVRHHNGISTLVRVPFPYTGVQEIWSLRYGRDLFDIDVSPDGLWITGSLVEISGRQSLVRMETARMEAGDFSCETLVEFEDNSPQNFVFSPDGKYLVGTSYYSGVSNVYRYDFDTQSTELLTNGESGFFRPLVVSDDSLVVFRYTGRGFVPAFVSNRPVHASAVTFLGRAIAQKFPEVTQWKLPPPSPEKISLDTLTETSGRYRSLSNLRLASLIPVVEGYKDHAAFGFRMHLMDPLGGMDNLVVTAAYSPNPRLPQEERIHLGWEYTHWGWTIHGALNGTDFYDLFGPTKTSRKGYSLGISHSGYLLYDKPRLLEYSFEANGYGGLEKLPEYQNIDASFDKAFSASAGLEYTYLIRSLGAVEAEEGVDWELASGVNWVKSTVYPRIHTRFDMGRLLPILHSSLWLRTSAGVSFGKRDEPFANFYFGGFGNNWVDFREFSRYRELESFPGAEINAIGGTKFGRAGVEWTLPPIRFRNFGMPSLYFRWVRAALFASGIVTNFDDRASRACWGSAGVQLDFRLVSLSIYQSTFSMGWAMAFERHVRPSHEWMVSFKIL